MMRMTSTMAGRSTHVLLLLLCVVAGTAGAQQRIESHTTPASAPGAAIPVAEVATQATEVATLLRTVRTEVGPSPALATIHTGLPEVSATIDLELAATSTLLQGQPTLAVLQRQQQRWQRRHQQTTGWLHVLTGEATHLQAVAHRLSALHTTWDATRVAAQQAPAPAPILQQIDATLADLSAAQTPLEAQRVAVLDLQSRVAHAVARCEQALAQLAQAQQQAVTGMLVRDGLPLWQAALWTEAGAALPARVRQVATAYWVRISCTTSATPPRACRWHVGLCLVLALAFGAARRQSPALADGRRDRRGRPQRLPAPRRGRGAAHAAPRHLALYPAPAHGPRRVPPGGTPADAAA